jgi:hypothetical protein
MNRRIYRDFDLPTKHLTGEDHFLPPKARDETEIERRQSLPPGTILLEHQHAGIRIAARILSRLVEPNDIEFSSEILAASGLNTAWYLSGQRAPVQRRRLKLEELATEDPEQRPTTYMLIQNAQSDFELAQSQSQQLIELHLSSVPTIDKQRKVLGRTIGHGALTLSCASLGDQIGYDELQLTDFELQDLARRRGLNALEQARTLAELIGTPPSLAQLGNADSDLSVYWRRQAPNGALDAYEQARAEVA